MKQILIISICFLIFLSCKKENTEIKSDQYLRNIQMGLKDSISTQDFQSLDISNSAHSAVDSIELYLLRIPFIEKSIKNDFLLLQTTREGKIIKGKIIHVEGSVTANGEGKVKDRRWDGNIRISSMDRKETLHSPIENGFITAFHPLNSLRTAIVKAPGDLPEVIVVAYVHNSGISFSEYIYLQSLLDNSGGGSYDGYYGSMGGTGSGSSGTPVGNGSTNNGGLTLDPLIQIDYEMSVYDPAIDIAKYLKCFENIPDVGANCTIEIFTDIPVDSDPNKLFDLSNQSPGHTFLQIKKSNNGQNAIQNIGFYPKTNWQSIITAAPVDGKFIDNGGHEFNASIKMTVTPENFQSIITEIKYLANFVKYDIDEYNCTDFALDVFNKIRTNKLEIPKYNIPGGITAGGTRTPQGLYNKLKQMKNSGNLEASNIEIGFQKAWVANSDGPCN